MRRLAAAEVLAVAAGAGFAGRLSFAFVAPTRAAWKPAAVHVKSTSMLDAPAQRRKAQQGGGGEDEAYREDNQRRFWDTVVEVLTQELGTGDQLSRVWEFVRHNRDGDDAPAASPSYRATGLYFPGLEAKPWWDRSELPWLRDLEAAAPDITLEMEALARAGGGAPYRGGSGEMSTVYDATQGWGTMRLRYMGRFDQPRINYSLLPRTLSALRRLPLAPETAAFQRQLPGTGLPLHVDPSNFVLGCHLGVVIPPPDGGGPVASNSGLVASNNSQRGGSGASGDSRRRGKKKRGRGRTSGVGAGGGGGGGFGFGGGGSAAAAGVKRNHGGAGRGEAAAVEGGGGGSPATRGSGGGAHGREGSGGDGNGDGDEMEESRDRSSTSTAYRDTAGGAGVGEALADKAGGWTAAAAAAVDAEEQEKEPGHRLPSGGGTARERAWIEVSGEKRHWQTGQAFVFDPSFLHRTHNPTAGERVILNVDVWHPGLEEVEKTAIRRVCELVEQWNSRTGLFK